MPPDIYDAIGEQWIMHPDMSLLKLRTIAIGTPEDEYSGNQGLSQDYIEAVGSEYLASSGMTNEKISILLHALNVEDVKAL
jgi:hypothetical protein